MNETTRELFCGNLIIYQSSNWNDVVKKADKTHMIGCRAATSLTDNVTEDGATDNVATLL